MSFATVGRCHVAAIRASCLAAIVLCGCAARIDPSVPLTPPLALCHHANGGATCRPPEMVEGWLRVERLRILDVADTPSGKQHAKVLTLAVPSARGEVVFRAKWRAHATRHALNLPRRELGAHAVQKLFLAPHEWVVPPTAGHCFELEHYRAEVDEDASPTFEGIPCVFGFLSYWLEGARDLDDAEDEGWIDDDDLAEFRGPNGRYERSVANVNLVSHLIDHGDSHPAQFVLTGGPARPRVHLVDNTIAFSEFRNPALEDEWDWSILQVRTIPRASAERLAAVDEAQVTALMVIEQYARRSGRLVHTSPGPPGLRTDMGYRWSGDELQVGLTAGEAARVQQRVRGVVLRLRHGALATRE